MKKNCLSLLFLLVIGLAETAFATTYTSEYPPAYNDTYVKASSNAGAQYIPANATNPGLSLVNSWESNSWVTTSQTTNMRFHIDLGSAKVIKRIYYENNHTTGTLTNCGVKTFTFWGSNSSSSFSDLTYANDTGWTQLTVDDSTFDIHVSANTPDPKYILVTNSTAYRYYAFKIADNQGNIFSGIRRVELQTEDAPTGRRRVSLIF